jgi:hypothetical protein
MYYKYRRHMKGMKKGRIVKGEKRKENHSVV